MEVPGAKKKPVSMEIGTNLQISLEGVNVPVTSSLVGMEINEYIIIKPPSPLSTVKYKLIPKTELIIKFLFEGKIIAFKARIIEFISKPAKLLFIEFPNKFVHHDLRSTERKNCAIPAKTVLNGIDKDGVIVDISDKGCGFSISYSKEDSSISIDKGEIIVMKCLFPGMEGEQSLFGLIRNIKRQNWEIILGVQFVDMPEEIQNKIDQFIKAVN